ncbi:unnamed protein product [Euphydryas editha]|uniref:DUF7869 domain-containing protein n=1 Tax=Euphydryas editha TaxID=104508 RepID=A0AAU9TQ60_EUPED|nr:unnamed protein product [Euphydryas editha]
MAENSENTTRIKSKKLKVKKETVIIQTETECDIYRLKIKLAALDETKTLLKKLHLLKVEKTYEIRRKEKQKAQEGKTMCVTFDFMQNLPLHHIRTSDVFFSRQPSWLYVFGIYNVGKNQVVLNSYLETEGKKGQKDVVTLLLRYFSTHGIHSDKLVLISDGCCGQDNNYVMVYFLYCLVHALKLFKSIKYIFSIRGHTYLPNDQDFSLIRNKKKKMTAEVPDDWNDLMETVRKNPSPFIVEKIKYTELMNIKPTVSLFTSIKTGNEYERRRMFKIIDDVPYVQVRYYCTDPWHRIQIRNKRKLPEELQFQPKYNSRLPINPHKL